MVELKDIIEKLFYLFSGGLIIEILAKESLSRAFIFSKVLFIILLISFSIYKLADYYEWAETIKDFIEEIGESILDFFEELLDD